MLQMVPEYSGKPKSILMGSVESNRERAPSQWIDQIKISIGSIVTQVLQAVLCRKKLKDNSEFKYGKKIIGWLQP